MVTESAKNNILEYINNALIPDEIKNILFQEIKEEKNQFYFCYASLFSEQLNPVIDEINIAGYLYYKYLITTDNFVDDSSSNKSVLKYLICSNFYLEESIRLLTKTFISIPEFWKYWNLRKLEYLNAFKTDKKFLTSLTINEFGILADNKSANGKVAIDSLLMINMIDKHTHEALLVSHKLFSSGFQYYDDVLDIKQDILNKQTNIALCEFKERVTQEEFDSLLNSPDKLVKLIHIKGIASTLLKKSITSFDEAEEKVQHLHCNLWKQVIALKKKEVKAVLQNIDFYLESLKIKIKLSNNKIQHSRNEVDNIFNSISLATKFISNEQEPNGMWKDSPVNTWLSGYWTTGYVLNAIQELDVKYLSTINTKQAVDYLIERENINWPYIHGWLEDADSTNFALLGLIANQQNINKEIDELLNYQQNDGGFTTYKSKEILLNYLNDPKISDVSGWTQSHVCVSAGALLLLSKLPNQFLEEKGNLINYLINNVSESGLWNSYWWTSPIYSTSLIIEASTKLNHPDLNLIIENSISALLKLQQENGLFADEFNNKHIFYSSLVLNSLCAQKELFIKYFTQIQLLVNAIIESQNEDGSWDSSFALRVPAADCINPLEIATWRKSDLGENVVIEDIHRVITTSTALSALSRYRNLKGL